MKNLKQLGKKLYSSKVLYIFIGVILLILCFNIIKNNIEHQDAEKEKYDNFVIEHEKLVEDYRHKLDSINKVNADFAVEQDRIRSKIDSISEKQASINKEYEKQINIIRDATLAEHAKWYDAKIDSLRHYYKPKD